MSNRRKPKHRRRRRRPPGRPIRASEPIHVYVGLLDPVAMRAARAREWRPSLPMLDRVIEEFCG